MLNHEKNNKIILNVEDGSSILEVAFIEKIDKYIYVEFLENIKNNSIGGLMIKPRNLDKEECKKVGTYRYLELYKIV